jgi:hypothetical protein
MNEAGSETSNCEANSNGAIDSVNVVCVALFAIALMHLKNGFTFIMQIPMSGISAFFKLFYAVWNFI